MANHIELKGVRVNNLKKINLNIDLNKLIVITGISGSGKSSLAFDTLYAEGQRRYVESLSSYARQFLGRLNKPEADSIKGIPPAVAIEQKVNTSNPRSTVGTSTEIYDYLKLLYARVGETISPISGEIVKRYSIDDIVNDILNYEGIEVIITVKLEDVTKERLSLLLSCGFSRVKYNSEFIRISDFIEKSFEYDSAKEFYLVIDRVVVDSSKDTVNRIADSLEIAFEEGDGVCFIDIDGKLKQFSNRFEADGIEFEEPSVNMFSFNSPLGACPKCEGYGKVLGIDEDLVIPDKSLSLYDGAVACWRGEKMSEWKRYFIKNSHKIDFPIYKSYYDLSVEERSLLWRGSGGINDFFDYLESNKYKIQNRVMIARYRGKTTCSLCNGTRLKKEATYVKIGGKSITELVDIPIIELDAFLKTIDLPEQKQSIAERILPDIKSRVKFLLDVGLGYLTLNRLSSTLSGGESQRINLVKSLGSALVGALYILDEPSIGLHSRDSDRLIRVLKRLKGLGNSVVVVEHDEDMILAADEIIDIGPLAGRLGGEVIFQGDIEQLKEANTLTSDYIFGRKSIPVPEKRRKSNYSIEISGATENNLKNISVSIPLGIMTAVSGVSGSGKSTLIKTILVPALKRFYEKDFSNKIGSFNKLTGDLDRISNVEFIDQNPIGKSSRSNPVTYIKAWDDIRKIFADQPLAKQYGFKPAHFSFNVPGGRCEECQGEGVIKVEMQFMADVFLECEHCKGKRFKEEVLEVNYRGKNIYDILEMTVDQAIDFFKEEINSNSEKNIVNKLQKLADVGLGYIKLGQSSATLSGGESQRVKLAYHLTLEKQEPILFLFDEPTTGLHFHDIHKLLESLNALIERGHSILIIEHNMEILKCVDYIIDLGPEGGEAGGYVVFAGTPEELANCPESFTGKYLKEKLKCVK